MNTNPLTLFIALLTVFTRAFCHLRAKKSPERAMSCHVILYAMLLVTLPFYGNW